MRHLVASAGDEGDQLVPDDVEASSNTLDVLVVPGRAVLRFLTAVMSLRTLQSGKQSDAVAAAHRAGGGGGEVEPSERHTRRRRAVEVEAVA